MPTGGVSPGVPIRDLLVTHVWGPEGCVTNSHTALSARRPNSRPPQGSFSSGARRDHAEVTCPPAVRRSLAIAAATACVAIAPAKAGAAAQPYQHNDGKGFLNIAPPGANGFASAPQIGAFLTSPADNRAYPPHSNDQLAMYGDLVYASPGLTTQDLTKYFKDASFGVKPEDVDRTYSPREDVTIVRDKQFGVPHIYG